MGIQILLNIQTMNTAIILTFLGLFGSLTDACTSRPCSSVQCIAGSVPTGNNALDCCRPAQGWMGRMGRMDRMGSVTIDDSIEPLAYAVCNTDGADGLSWREVEACEAKYCKDLPFDCPTKADYVFFDADHNGVLTWSEWKTLHG